MKVYNDISLKRYNTFGIDVKAEHLIECESLSDFETVAKGDGHRLVLGGGSNMLFLSDHKGLIIHPTMSGHEIVNEKGNDVIVRAAAGTDWDSFVSSMVTQGFHGLENLSGIPGTVGASPVQNVGAYGADASQVVCRVEGYWFGTGEKFILTGDDCRFGYRNSIFKNEMKNRAIVSLVDYHLYKDAPLNLDYGPVRQMVESMGGASLTNVRNAILNIRNQKLPDPKVQGSAGSFFKNPEVSTDVASRIAKDFTDVPQYQLPDGRVKIPAGWLIERAGWKGRALGEAAVHDKQALVLVNRGNATGSDVMALAEAICNDVKKMFDIELDMEVCKI